MPDCGDGLLSHGRALRDRALSCRRRATLASRARASRRTAHARLSREAGRGRSPSCRCSRLCGSARARGRPTRPPRSASLLLVPLLDSLALRPPRRLLRRMALGERHHAAARASRAARAFAAVAAFAAKLGAVSRRPRDAPRDDARQRISFCLRSSASSRSVDPGAQRALLWGWLAGGLLYVFVVVTVERVDYYMLPLLPLCALVDRRRARALRRSRAHRRRRAGGALRAARRSFRCSRSRVLLGSRAPVAAYYAYNQTGVSQRASCSTQRARPETRWSSSDTTAPTCSTTSTVSAGRKTPRSGRRSTKRARSAKARATSSPIEDNRLRHNAELCAWLQRFPVLERAAQWPVYETDPAKSCPAPTAFWRAFRTSRTRRSRDAPSSTRTASAALRAARPLDQARARAKGSGATAMLPRYG